MIIHVLSFIRVNKIKFIKKIISSPNDEGCLFLRVRLVNIYIKGVYD